MSNFLFITSILFLYIAGVSSWKWKNLEDSWSLLPNAMLIITTIIGFIIPLVCLCKITAIAWYWCFLINIVGIVFISHIIAPVLNSIGEYQRAIGCFQKAITINPKLTRAYNNMGFTYANFSNYKQAIICFQDAININPNDPDIGFTYYNLGLSYCASKNVDQAITCFQKSAKTGLEPAKKNLRALGYNW